MTHPPRNKPPSISSSTATALQNTFGRYEREALISSLASLLLNDKNHSKYFRIEAAVKAACSIGGSGKKTINVSDLREIFSTQISSSSYEAHQDDPQENLFTQNINFFGGNYVIYPGNLEQGVHSLQAILNAIFLDKRLTELHRATGDSVLALLLVSNEVAKKFGHESFIQGSLETSGDPIVPSAGALRSQSQSLLFSYEELVGLFSELRISIASLEPFSIKLGDPNLKNLGENQLLKTPLIQLEGAYLVALPTGFVTALLDYLHRQAVQLQLRDEVTRSLRDDQFRLYLNHVERMGYRIMVGTEEEPKQDNIQELVFELDADKVGQLIVVVDDGVGYPERDPFGSFSKVDLGDSIAQRREALSRTLEIGEKSQYKEIFTLVVPLPTGRGIGISINRQGIQDGQLVMIFSRDLWLVLHDGELDLLDLWKFSQARMRWRKQFDVLTWGFLDEFCYYLERGHTFYRDGMAETGHISLSPWGNEFAARILKETHFHSVYHEGIDGDVLVRRGYKNTFTPVYFPVSDLRERLSFVVGGYPKPVWVQSAKPDKEILKPLWHVYKETGEAIAYWLWQMTSELQSIGLIQECKTLLFEYELVSEEEWAGKIESVEVAQAGMVEVERTPCGLSLKFRPEWQCLLLNSDNRAERYLLERMVAVLLPEKSSQAIVDKVAPLGFKKKLSVIDSADDPRLIRGEREPRLLQKHDTNYSLDGVVEVVDPAGQLVGRSLTRDEKLNVLRDVVKLYTKRVRDELSKYDPQTLIETLLHRTEALISLRALTRLWSPLRMSCFSDFPTEVASLKEDLARQNRTSLALRLLLEIAASVPQFGDAPITTTGLDYLTANIYTLVSYAGMSDEVYFNIHDHDFQLLKTGRIGIDQESANGLLGDFWHSKTEELVRRLSKSKDRRESDDNEETFWNGEAIAKGLLAEFGLTMDEVAQFMGTLKWLPYGKGEEVIWMPKSEVIKEIGKMLSWPETKVEQALTNFTLKPLTPGEEVKGKESYLWRYNRTNSLIRRPVIELSTREGVKILTWGMRQVQESFENLFSLIFNARLIARTPEMVVAIGMIGDRRGEPLNLEVYEWVKPQYPVVEKQVDIGTGKPFSADKNYGDIDVLAIDVQARRMFLIDTKDLNIGREPSEISNELKRFFKEEKGYVPKHHNRCEWVRTNLRAFLSHFGLAEDHYEVVGVIVTSEDIPSRYHRQSSDIQVIPFTALEVAGSLNSIIA